MSPVFETERLTVRFLVPEDFDDLYRMYSDPEMREFFPDGTLNADQTREELEWFLNGGPRDPRLGLWAFERKSDGAFVGRGGLLQWDVDGVREIEIAYMIDKACWRLGYGSEAARGLVDYGFSLDIADHLIALTDPRHTASIKTAEAAGLSYWKDSVVDGTASAIYRVERSDSL